MPDVARPIITYGLQEGNDVRAVDIRQDGLRTHFTLLRNGMEPLPVTLNLPGLHNVQNALAAIAVATDEKASDAAILRALAGFQGVGRRFQQYGDFPLADGSVRLVDDYGHHPSEVAATLAAARSAWPDRRIVMAYQPHRYTRTRDCFGEFVRVLQGVDALALTEVYPAGEARISGADGEALIKALAKAKEEGRLLDVANTKFIKDVNELPNLVMSMARDGDVIITMGAGSISAVPGKLAGGSNA
mgnify:CR=1 FL=1